MNKTNIIPQLTLSRALPLNMGQGRQAAALAITCLFPILAALFVAARTVSRHLGQNFGWDDWLIHLGLLLLLGETITAYECMILIHYRRV